MTRRKGFALLAGVLLMATGLWFAIGRTPLFAKKAGDYNVLVISMDTCRADFLSLYGNTTIQTPHLERLAAKGVVLDHFYSAINTTLPSHASLFTGLYPRNHGVARNAMRLHTRNLTLAEYLHSQGYTTAAFIGSFALASIFGLNQGFQVYEEGFIGDPNAWIGRTVELKTSEGKTLESLEPGTKTGDITRTAEDVNRAFFQWLDGNANRKFFAFIHYYDPHFPYYPPEKWYRKHLSKIPEGTPITEKDRVQFYSNFRAAIGAVENFRPGSLQDIEFPPVLQAMMLLYGAEIEYTDDAVGKVLDRLDQKKLTEKTIVIVTSDHGENLIEHQKFNSFFRHGTLTHETEIHVPFIISAPGVLPEKKRMKNLYSQIDFVPTLLDLLDLKQPGKYDGQSFYQDFFQERVQEPRPLFFEASQPRLTGGGVQEQSWPNNGNSASVRYGEYKYMHVPWKKYEAVFHIPNDDLEEQNLLKKWEYSDPQQLSHIRSLLKAWRGRALFGNIDSTFQLSEEDREKLESLGYVQ